MSTTSFESGAPQASEPSSTPEVMPLREAPLIERMARENACWPHCYCTHPDDPSAVERCCRCGRMPPEMPEPSPIPGLREGEEPPMTAEEEEQVPEDPCDCGHPTPHRRADCGGEAEPFLAEQSQHIGVGAKEDFPRFHLTKLGKGILRHVSCVPVEEAHPSHTGTHETCPTCWHGREAECMCCHNRLADAPLPPQPERRPPHAVTYSVHGHPYKLVLPGDALVEAVDGGLIIRHTLGPVAGITGVVPVETEEN
jgi:hypothetical protein